MAWQILVVVNEENLREDASAALQRAGHHVECVSDRRTALAAVIEKQFDLIVCGDLTPNATSEQIAAVSLTARNRANFIMLSSRSGRHERTPNGVDLVLKPPVSLDTLMEAISKVMN